MKQAVFQAYNELASQDEEKIRKYMIDPTKKQEMIYLSINLVKINKRTTEQQRMLIITNLGIYNVKKRDVRRTVKIENIAGVTISNSSTEFVIHGLGEYDLRYKSPDREKILKYLIISYTKAQNKKLKFYITNKDILKDYCTQENEFKKKINNQPTWEPILVDGFMDINIFFANALLQQPVQQKVLYIDNQDIYKIWINDFETELIIGKGSLGDVYLVKQKGSDMKESYALKKLTEKDIGTNNLNRYEKLISENQNVGFFAPLKFAFRQNNDFYILTQFLPGGDLYKQINNNQYMSEEAAKFYFVEVALALQYCHANQIVYKDLKPENILIDESGHTYLSSYGFAYCDNYSQEHVITTLDYTAPEILNGNKHSFASDYWSLGVLLYEMVTGITPFYHENEELSIYLIKENSIIFPQQNQQKISKECQNLILGLLNSNEKKRFQFQEILVHPWLKSIQWDLFEVKGVPPPFIPQLKQGSAITGKYFDYKLIEKRDINF
ncbi:Protein kinase-like domain [Pseudocohnilembus persalinus]|uniref:Protein kinase-like domain n=1 Tax=Pseudocohnilembus persalinus TaxID=266149 RepID=A0A0V0QTL8_PSEPJ|nr:Protein kinase-like domain [Pseudocohnilembus persalinus]|eukprot:KRX05676.1 Protein kinase-like domain [Pseudocohnilembus persalinus]